MIDMPSCSKQINRKARKSHKCCECNGVINPGEKYTYISGIWKGEPASYKQCNKCHVLFEDAIFLLDEFDCEPEEGPPLGGLFDWVSNFTYTDGNKMADALGI